MKKVIAVFGVGPGLGLGVARYYAQKGYRIALLARSVDHLSNLQNMLIAEGHEAESFRVDLADRDSIVGAIEAVKRAYGRIDAIHYSPNGNGGFIPANALNPDDMLHTLQVMFLGLVTVVQSVLPEFRRTGKGLILAGFGGSAANPAPFMSGPGPAMAATRNYLYSLKGELARENIHVGMITVSAVIRSSLFHQALQAGQLAIDLPAGMEVPEVEPSHLASLLDETANSPTRAEAFFP